MIATDRGIKVPVVTIDHAGSSSLLLAGVFGTLLL
jgi:hypothetical protein